LRRRAYPREVVIEAAEACGLVGVAQALKGWVSSRHSKPAGSLEPNEKLAPADATVTGGPG